MQKAERRSAWSASSEQQEHAEDVPFLELYSVAYLYGAKLAHMINSFGRNPACSFTAQGYQQRENTRETVQEACLIPSSTYIIIIINHIIIITSIDINSDNDTNHC